MRATFGLSLASSLGFPVFCKGTLNLEKILKRGKKQGYKKKLHQ
jgi:hypothetical protein